MAWHWHGNQRCPWCIDTKGKADNCEGWLIWMICSYWRRFQLYIRGDLVVYNAMLVSKRARRMVCMRRKSKKMIAAAWNIPHDFCARGVQISYPTFFWRLKSYTLVFFVCIDVVLGVTCFCFQSVGLEIIWRCARFPAYPVPVLLVFLWAEKISGTGAAWITPC